MKLEQVEKISEAINNFKACYDGNEISGVRDGPVDAIALIEFLIEHPELAQIAEQINQLQNGR
jgi:hypothetical protein